MSGFKMHAFPPDWKIVRWCGTRASSHNSQFVFDEKVNEAGMSTMAPGMSAVLCC